MADVLVLQHEESETLGILAGVLRDAGLSARYIRPYIGETVPQVLGSARGLIVLGGPMGVYETQAFPHLIQEIELIQDALAHKRPILGICLGCQLLAAALGARVYPGTQKEIGWYPIELTPAAAQDTVWKAVPSPFVGLHWHGDVFDLPDGAVHLASSELTANQAFVYGGFAYGHLCHMEMTEAIIHETAAGCEDYFATAGIHPADIFEGIPSHLPQLHQVGSQVFQQWAGLLL